MLEELLRETRGGQREAAGRLVSMPEVRHKGEGRGRRGRERDRDREWERERERRGERERQRESDERGGERRRDVCTRTLGERQTQP